MEQTFGSDQTGEKLKLMLHDNADGIEEISYFKAHDGNEGVELRGDLANQMVILSEIEEEKKETDERFKELMKPSKDKVKELLSEIRENGKHVVEKCYKIIFLEENMVGYYNEVGHLVRSRPVTNHEKQLNVFKTEEIPLLKKVV